MSSSPDLAATSRVHRLKLRSSSFKAPSNPLQRVADSLAATSGSPLVGVIAWCEHRESFAISGQDRTASSSLLRFMRRQLAESGRRAGITWVPRSDSPLTVDAALTETASGQGAVPPTLVFADAHHGGVLALAAALSGGSTDPRRLQDTLTLAAEAAAGQISARTATEALEVWRERRYGSPNPAQHGARQRSDTAKALAAATAEFLGLAPRQRLPALCRFAAEWAPTEAALVAVQNPRSKDGLSVVHVSGLGRAVRTIDSRWLLAHALRHPEAPLVRSSKDLARGAYPEDCLFGRAGFASCAALAFPGGAMVLGARRRLSPRQIANLHAFAQSIGPLIHATLSELEAERYKQLAVRMGRRVLSASLAERARIARMLHDEHAQLWAALKIAASGPSEHNRQRLAKLESELRDRIRSLRPPQLGKIRLDQAIRDQLARAEEAGLTARLVYSVGRFSPSDELKILCYEVVREGISNVLQHANASEILVEVRRDAAGLHIAVTDNGRGGLIGRGDSRGVGLAGIRERASLVGGLYRLRRSRVGTKLSVFVPLI